MEEKSGHCHCLSWQGGHQSTEDSLSEQMKVARVKWLQDEGGSCDRGQGRVDSFNSIRIEGEGKC